MSVIDQKAIETNILNKYFPCRYQLTVDSLLGNEKSERELIYDAYKLANKEIGYRVENLNTTKK